MTDRRLFPEPSDAHRRMGSQFMERNVISSGAFRDVPVGDSLWACGALDDRMWLWTLHSFLVLDGLFAIGRHEELRYLIADWMTQFADQPVEADFPWHDHATALRLDRLSRYAIETGDLQFQDHAAKHADLLLNEDFYSRHTNHGFDQAVSLLLAAVAYPHAENAARWREVGAQRLVDEARIAFTDEGIHIENSPGYHAGMLMNLERAARIYAAAGEKEPLFNPAFLDGAVEFLSWVMRPDRFLALIGDTSLTRSSVPEMARNCPSYQHFIYAQSGGQEGAPPDKKTRIYPSSGYAFYRSRWDPWDNHMHIAFKSGFLSRYHRQDDDLNILLHAHGEEWLIDSGLYGHNQNDPVRVYMRSAEAHNVPVICGEEAARNGPRTSSRLYATEASSFPFDVTAVTEIYPGHRLVRRVCVQHEDTIQVDDRIVSNAPKPVVWYFHVPLDKRVFVSPGRARIHGRGATLHIRVAGGKSLPVSVYSGFGEGTKSVTSLRPNHRQDSQVIVFGPSQEKRVRFALTFDERT